MFEQLISSLILLALSGSLAAGLPVGESPAGEGGPQAGRGGALVDWYPGPLSEALEEAQRRDDLILIEFWADWCGWCALHERENLSDPKVTKSMAGFVCVSADLSADADGQILNREAEALMNRFAVRRFPTLVFLDPSGDPEDLISGFLPAESLLAEFDRIAEGRNTRSDLERLARKHPGDLEQRHRLALKLDELGDGQGYQREMDFIRAADPAGRSLPMRRLALGRLREELWGCMRDPDIDPDPTQLVSFLEAEQHPELLCNGWLLMGTVRDELGETRKSLAAFREAWSYAPPEYAAQVGNGIAWGFWLQRDELGAADRSFALEVAREALRSYERETPTVDPALLASYLDTLACCEFMSGHRTEAIRLSEKCIGLDPGAAEYEQRLAFFKE